MKSWKIVTGNKPLYSNLITYIVLLMVDPKYHVILMLLQGSHKLWKSWKITKKSSMHGKIMEFEKTLNNHGKIIEFCEIV